MPKIFKSSHKKKESNPTAQSSTESSSNNEGYRNSVHIENPDDGIDYEALGALASTITPQPSGRKLSKKEAKAAKKEFAKQQKASKSEKVAASKEYKNIHRQLKDRDKELSSKNEAARVKRATAKDVLSYIGYKNMFVDGVCEVEDGLFSKTISFEDTSYHSIREEMQKGMFSSMCRLYDQFGADTLIQMQVINTPLLKSEIGNRKFFDPTKQPTQNCIQAAETFNDILNQKVREGVSNIKRNRYITLSVSADNYDQATQKLARAETAAMHVLNTMGSKATVLNGIQRLAIIHQMLNPGKPFDFSYKRDIRATSNLSTKDFIAPLTINWKPEGFSDCVTLDGKWGQVLVMKKFGSELSDRALADLADLAIPLNITWFAQPMDKAKAVNLVRRNLAWTDKEIIEEQRSAVAKGYDFDIIPHELRYSKEEAEDVLDNLQNKNQRLFSFTGLIYTYADTKEELDNQILQIISAGRQNSIEIDVFDLRQREGLNSILPLGHNHTKIVRTFTSAQLGILVPFATQELDDEGANYYGQNKHSRNLVLCNRRNLTSPVAFICGKTGSGKGMFCKSEITQTILNYPEDEVFIIDRAGEYTDIARTFNGNVFDFAVASNTRLNPFDCTSQQNMSIDEQIAFKIDAMLAQAGASAFEAGQNLSEIDQSIITRCVEQIFAPRRNNEFVTAPLLGDFYAALRQQPEPEAKAIALRYERFVKGSMSFFNSPSNVHFDKRIIDFNLKELPDTMLVFALINVCEAVRNRMYYNHERGVRTWLYVEEMQSLFAYPTVLNYFSRFANEGRKFGLLLTGITQNATAMLANDAARNIVLNADFIMLLKQSPVDRLEWSRLLSLSPQEEECIDESVEPGDGLLIAGAARVPIHGKFPSGNVLYKLFSTNPNEIQKK